MTAITAREALEYAFTREILTLYAVIGGGILAITTSRVIGVLPLALGPVRQLLPVIGGLVFLAGMATLIGGLVALLYKVVADAANTS